MKKYNHDSVDLAYKLLALSNFALNVGNSPLAPRKNINDLHKVGQDLSNDVVELLLSGNLTDDKGELSSLVNQEPTTQNKTTKTRKLSKTK